MNIYLKNKKPIAAAIARGVATGFGLKKKEAKTDMEYQKFKAHMARYEKERAEQPPHEYAKDAWEALTAAGVTDGKEPCAPMTREQYAVMEQRQGAIRHDRAE